MTISIDTGCRISDNNVMTTGLNRRSFLRLTGATLSAAAFPPVIQKALAIPAANRTGTIMDVEHVVFLMQENRSFDHYYGTMPGVRGFGDRFTIPLPGGRSVWEQQLANGTTILPYHLDSTIGNAQRVFGTPHSWSDAHDAWNKGAMGQWPRYKQQQSMGYYTEAELAFHFALAQAFTIGDAYHCAAHSGTNTNRLFMFTGMNDPFATGNGPAITNQFDSVGPSSSGYTWTTFPERLEAAGVSWKVYQDVTDNFSDNSLQGFQQYRAALENGTPAALRDKAMVTTLTRARFDELRADVVGGTLPQVSWIVPPAGFSEHPAPSSPVLGAYYTGQVLAALTADPEVWSKTVLFYMFDENDGFFDHVPPPGAPSLNADLSPAGASTVSVLAERHTDGQVYGMGPRVPLIAISPWSRGGWVNSEVFDHTSLIRFVEQRFGVQEPNISPWRRAVAGDLTSMFEFRKPNRRPFPSLSPYSLGQATAIQNQQASQPQVPVPQGAAGTFPAQELGIRPSRPLTYKLHADAAVEAADARVRLTFTNAGPTGAVFHVYDKLHLDAVPRRYTVEGSKVLDDTWAAGVDVSGQYDLFVLGPNGFHRHFQGTVSPADTTRPEVQIQYDGRRVVVILMNDGTAPCTFDVLPNAYRRSGLPGVTVAPGGSVARQWRTKHGWYDLSVTCAEQTDFVRRCAGRVESGRPSVTDPALR